MILGSADIVTVVSDTGYRLAIWTTGRVDPNFVEVELDAAPADCVDVTSIPGFDASNPLHLNNTEFAVESVDPLETGVGSRLGGQLTIRAP